VKNTAQVQLQVRVAEVSRNRGKELGSSFATAKGGTSVFNSENGPATLTNILGGVFEAAFSGANLAIFNNTLGTQAIIHALQTQGSLRMLAEPNLIAMDGQQASFLAGGEFPIPIVQGGERPTVTIVFK